MSKRYADNDVPERVRGTPAQKRQRTAPPEQVEEIFSARQLQGLLTFRQDDMDRLRNGVASFKVILDNILYSKEEQTRGSQLSILREFLDLSKPKDSAASYLPDLMQAWSFAIETSNERLSTSVSSILALLVKTISGELDLREYGTLLCKTLLQRDQVKLISRGLSAEAHKEHLISPCLRMVTEIVAFDGGALAYQVFDRQDSTFNPKFLDRNLRLFRTTGDEDRRKVSVRSNAIRYLLANLRYQPLVNRIRILEYRNLFRTLFDNLKNDTFEVIRDVLRGVETHVLREQEIPRRLKSAILTDKALANILEVARTEKGSDTAADETSGSRSTEVLSFLVKVSTHQDLGILLGNGWYPAGADKTEDDDEPVTGAEADLDLYDSDFDEITEITVRNVILSKFLQVLRPQSDLEERKLALAIFSAAPELVADYIFQGRNRFSLEPKLTNTWIGYASFFFSLAELPIPQFFGRGREYGSKPPPSSIVIENILPSPLTAKVMTRCLNQASDLVTLFAIRILTVSLEKLGTLLAMYREASKEFPAYNIAAKRLVSEFEESFPTIKDLVSTTKKVAENNMVLREASTRLVRIYQHVMPQAAAEESFDVVGRLVALLEQSDDLSSEDDAKLLRELELQHLLVIAGHSSGMRWWNKQGSLPFSPYVVLLRLCASDSSSLLKTELEPMLENIAHENGLFQKVTKKSAFSALLSSLSSDGGWAATDATFSFVDECVGRLIRKPIKYIDDLDVVAKDDESKKTRVSLLILACLEQAPFASRMPDDQRNNVLTWLARFLVVLEDIGEEAAILQKVRKDLTSQKIVLPKIRSEDLSVPEPKTKLEASAKVDVVQTNGAAESDTKQDTIELTKPPTESNNHPELRRWQNADVEEAVQDGIIGQLALCLCSQYPEIRKQALIALRGYLVKVLESNYEAKEQLELLVGELIETAAAFVDTRPMAYIGGSFATHALEVLTSPTHFMFAKVNKYLLKDPQWNVRKLPDYWLGKTILEMPEEDNTYWRELIWVLDMLVDGVRTAEDVNVLRSRNVFERLLALTSSPSAGHAVRSKIAQLVYRSMCAGGSTTLVTSCGIVAWLKMQKANQHLDEATVSTLIKTLAEEMDASKVEEWSGHLMREELASLHTSAT